MARITIEDCLRRVPNRFMLVHMAAKRVRQIREGSEYLVSSPKNEDIVVALREVAAGKVYFAETSETDESEETLAVAETEETGEASETDGAEKTEETGESNETDKTEETDETDETNEAKET